MKLRQSNFDLQSPDCYLDLIDRCPKFETGLNIRIGIVQKVYRVDFKFSDTLNVNLWLIGSY